MTEVKKKAPQLVKNEPAPAATLGKPKRPIPPPPPPVVPPLPSAISFSIGNLTELERKAKSSLMKTASEMDISGGRAYAKNGAYVPRTLSPVLHNKFRTFKNLNEKKENAKLPEVLRRASKSLQRIGPPPPPPPAVPAYQPKFNTAVKPKKQQTASLGNISKTMKPTKMQESDSEFEVSSVLEERRKAREERRVKRDEDKMKNNSVPKIPVQPLGLVPAKPRPLETKIQPQVEKPLTARPKEDFPEPDYLDESAPQLKASGTVSRNASLIDMHGMENTSARAKLKLMQCSDLSLTNENSQFLKRSEVMSSKYTLDESKYTRMGCSMSNFDGSNETQSIKTKPKTSKEILQEIARLTNGTSSHIRTTDAETSFKSKSVVSHNS